METTHSSCGDPLQPVSNRFSSGLYFVITSYSIHYTKLYEKTDDEEASKPWETIKTTEISKNDFPGKTEVVKANMLFIPKAGFSQKALNHLKRLAAFKNPEFYKAQAMRLPTFDKPRIISCSDETAEYLCLPRGCETDIMMLFEEMKTKVSWIDKTNHGRKIDVAFKGTLRDEQPLAVERLLEHDNGILCGTTAFGKTVAAIKLITERKLNTLILVDKVSLVSQWKEKLSAFLTINEKEISHPVTNSDINQSQDDLLKKRGRITSYNVCYTKLLRIIFKSSIPGLHKCCRFCYWFPMNGIRGKRPFCVS